jgi:hypothetical protein
VKVFFDLLANPIKNKNEEIIHAFDNEKWLYYDLEFPKSAYEQIQKMLKEKIVSVKPLIKVIERCPKCKRKGIPKIEEKDVSDNRFRSWRNKEEHPRVNRTDEYWVTYDHKTKPMKCRVLRFVSLLESREVKFNKKQGIIMEEFIFPYCVGFLKRQYQNNSI